MLNITVYTVYWLVALNVRYILFSRKHCCTNAILMHHTSMTFLILEMNYIFIGKSELGIYYLVKAAYIRANTTR